MYKRKYILDFIQKTLAVFVVKLCLIKIINKIFYTRILTISLIFMPQYYKMIFVSSATKCLSWYNDLKEVFQNKNCSQWITKDWSELNFE